MSVPVSQSQCPTFDDKFKGRSHYRNTTLCHNIVYPYTLVSCHIQEQTSCLRFTRHHLVSSRYTSASPLPPRASHRIISLVTLRTVSIYHQREHDCTTDCTALHCISPHRTESSHGTVRSTRAVSLYRSLPTSYPLTLIPSSRRLLFLFYLSARVTELAGRYLPSSLPPFLPHDMPNLNCCPIV